MVLITGANGFVGSALAQYLSRYCPVRALVRSNAITSSTSSIEYIYGYELTKQYDLGDALSGIDVIVHCAARVHVMQETSANPMQAFRQANVHGTTHLASQAAKAGVKRFIYLSSVKVNGEFTDIGRPFTPEDKPSSSDPYGISKYEAELALQEIAAKTGMELVIIRPPLIYGPRVKANFAALIRLVKSRLPLPFALVKNNRRSFVALENLLSFIKVCMTHPRAANQIFLISDGADLSTAALLNEIALAGQWPIFLVPIPTSILRWLLKAIGKSEIAERLLGTLQVDISKCHRLLGWTPALSVHQGLMQVITRDEK